MREIRPQHRPPFDLLCPMLQIVDGCTHGKCHFCDIYPEIPFQVMPWEEVLEGIEAIAAESTALTRRIYLTGGNPYALSNERLIKVFDAVEERIPTVKSYGGFCRITDIKAKSDEELAELRDRGVSNIVIGAECGDDDVLSFMEKGQTAADLVEQGKRLHEAGIDFTFFYLAGIAGAGKTQESALKSARVFSEAAPKQILIMTLTPTKSWPLAKDIEAGLWEPAGEAEVAREIQTFIANLTCETSINCSHDSNVLRFDGIIPDNQENMVQLLDNLIPKMHEGAARKMRELIHQATF